MTYSSQLSPPLSSSFASINNGKPVAWKMADKTERESDLRRLSTGLFLTWRKAGNWTPGDQLWTRLLHSR